MRDIVLTLTFALASGTALAADAPEPNEWFVAPDGKPANTGAKEAPWDIETAFAHPAAVKPGDTIWLRGGTHTLKNPNGVYTKLKGTQDAPITVRQWPGERATVDLAGKGLYLCGAWTDYRDFEVTSVGADRARLGSLNIGGADIGGEHNRIIGLIVHDTGNIGFWRSAVESELYGCIIYNNGSFDANRVGHGHAVYAQNVKGERHVTDNICFNQFSRGIAPHGSLAITDLYVEGNISFGNGSISSGPYANLYHWAAKDSNNIRWIKNCTYHTAAADKAAGVDVHAGREIIFEDNYLVGGGPALGIFDWDKIVATGNTVVAASQLVCNVLPAGGKQTLAVDRNTYYLTGENAKGFFLKGAEAGFAAWQKATGADANSQLTQGAPKTNVVFVRPSKYDPGRANICIYNWEKKDRVSVDVSVAGLKEGDKYEVRDAQNWFGDPMVTGTSDGKAVVIPMTNLAVAQPQGTPDKDFKPARHTGPEFGAFVIRRVPEPRKAD
jgi:hypothetical protein